MSKYFLLFGCLLFSINSIAQTNRGVKNNEIHKLIGKWKSVLVRMTDDNSLPWSVSSPTIFLQFFPPLLVLPSLAFVLKPRCHQQRTKDVLSGI